MQMIHSDTDEYRLLYAVRLLLVLAVLTRPLLVNDRNVSTEGSIRFSNETLNLFISVEPPNVAQNLVK